MKTPLASSWRGLPAATYVVVVAVALAVTVLALAPAIPQDQGYHQFADQRHWLGVPHAADVLSNLAFALVGVFGVARLVSPRRTRFSPATESGLWCIALGIVGTALGSAWYHHGPTDATLVWDRLPMTVVFAGVLGVAASQRLGNDLGRWGLAVLVPLGIASIVYWKLSGDLSIYVALQLGGFGAIALLLAITPGRDDPFPWLWLVVLYGFAKFAEFGDQAIWDATRGLIAGHTLKHLLAAAAVAAALWPLRDRR